MPEGELDGHLLWKKAREDRKENISDVTIGEQATKIVSMLHPVISYGYDMIITKNDSSCLLHFFVAEPFYETEQTAF